MAFIRRRLSGKQDGSSSYQILEAYRQDGKVRQRVLYNMGPCPTIQEARVVQRKFLADYEEDFARYRDLRVKPASERPYLMKSDADLDWHIQICQRAIERTKENIAFLKRVVVSNKDQFLSDTTLDVYHWRLAHLSNHRERLGVVSKSPCGAIDTTG